MQYLTSLMCSSVHKHPDAPLKPIEKEVSVTLTSMTASPDLELFRFRWDDFPALTQDLPGTGGVIRSTPEDFRVTEIPLYLPDGKGSHAYVRVRKTNLTTRDLVLALMQEGLKEKEIGVAGLKDKFAVAEQWLSVPNKHAEALAKLDDVEGVEVLERSRHKNKLGIGHLLGNRFSIRVREVARGASERATEVLLKLERDGLPNYFGPQRFGRFGSNAIDGYKLIKGEHVPGGHRLKGFFIAALQSLFFNHLLKKRLEMDVYTAVLEGDWAKKHDTGGVFKVEDALLESPRASRKEISATFPLYGKKVKMSEAEAGRLEQETLDFFGLKWTDFTSRRGDRRFSRILLSDVSVEPQDDGYTLHFALPKGSFATSVLREVMKVEVDAPLESTRSSDNV